MAPQQSLGEIGLEIREAERIFQRSPDRAFNNYWLCLIKLSHLLPLAGEEHEQALALLRTLQRPSIAALLKHPAIDELLQLDPPLDHVLASTRERLNPIGSAKHLRRVEQRRVTDPKGALAALFELLDQIRDRREHGFKSPYGARDQAILAASSALLRGLCLECFAALSASESRQHQSRPGA